MAAAALIRFSGALDALTPVARDRCRATESGRKPVWLVRRRPPVVHQHEERLIDVAEPAADVFVDREVRRRLHRRAKLGGNLRRQLHRAQRRTAHDDGQPHEHGNLHDEDRRQQRDESKRDPPIEASVPDSVRHRQTCSRYPRPSG